MQDRNIFEKIQLLCVKTKSSYKSRETLAVVMTWNHHCVLVSVQLHVFVTPSRWDWPCTPNIMGLWLGRNKLDHPIYNTHLYICCTHLGSNKKECPSSLQKKRKMYSVLYYFFLRTYVMTNLSKGTLSFTVLQWPWTMRLITRGPFKLTNFWQFKWRFRLSLSHFFFCSTISCHR